MDTAQLETLLHKHSATRSIFGGVLARDQLPIRAQHRAYIVNLDKSSEPGSHWVAIVFSNNFPAEYFDSYGMPPIHHDIKKFLENNSIQWTYNSICLQSYRTAVCGQYCAYYIIQRRLNKSMREILTLFNSTNHLKNDRYVKTYIQNILRIELPFYIAK